MAGEGWLLDCELSGIRRRRGLWREAMTGHDQTGLRFLFEWEILDDGVDRWIDEAIANARESVRITQDDQMFTRMLQCVGRDRGGTWMCTLAVRGLRREPPGLIFGGADIT